MTFTSPAFFWFMLAALPLWWLTAPYHRVRVALMVIASFVFYGHNQWWVMALLAAYCAVDWAVGLWIERSRRPRAVLALGIAFNLVLLAYWKYTPLVVATLGLAMPADWQARLASWEIPMGISFYAFTGIAYMVDVYRGALRAERDPATFTLFKSFFPQLVAGPILRGREFLPALQPLALPLAPPAPLEASILIARGLFKKMVLADRIAAAIDPFLLHVADPATAGVWSLPYVYLYALQIYLDFSGYTDIARGLGLWFGFRWPENFARPYLAASIQDFWRRWHMTLSRFLRDYLYIPLGGNRHGPARAFAALAVTMLLGGLWHGASWSFVLWGALHGAYLVVGRLWQASAAGRRLAALPGWRGRLWTVASVVLTFHAVCVGWCFFRLTDVAAAAACLRKWFVFDADKLLVGDAADPALLVLLLAYGLASLAIAALTRDAGLTAVTARLAARGFRDGLAWGAAAGVLALAIALAPAGRAPPFIYFRF